MCKFVEEWRLEYKWAIITYICITILLFKELYSLSTFSGTEIKPTKQGNNILFKLKA